VYAGHLKTAALRIKASTFPLQPSRNQPAMHGFPNFTMIVTAHHHI